MTRIRTRLWSKYEEEADEHGVEHDEEQPRDEHAVGEAPVRLDVA